MDWKQAKHNTLELWRGIRSSIGEADPLDLLTEINAVCDLCGAAGEQRAAGELDNCQYCLFYRQFGGCRGINADMSECIAARDWDQLRVLADRFIAHLEAMEVPPAQTAASG